MAVIHSVFHEVGRVTIDRETCSECGECATICPTETLKRAGETVTIHEDTPFGCIACGHCMMVCPTGSVEVRGRGISPEDVQPFPEEELRGRPEVLEALMLGRRSVRRFRDQEVDPALLERIVQVASSAPMGIPPWDVGCVVVRGREPVRRLASEVVKGYEGFLKIFRPWLLAILRPFMRRTLHEQFTSFLLPLARGYVDAERWGEDAMFYEAPAVLIFHRSPYADAVDAAIACTYAMLAAESLGLGSTMIGGAPPIIQRNRALCRRLGVPDGNVPALCLIVGHPAVRFRKSLRRRFTSVRMVGNELLEGTPGKN
jgi:ferredoxin